MDYGIASPELADYIEIHPFYDHPCKPHVVAVDFDIHMGLQVDQGYVLDVPKEISISYGPREFGDTWWAHFNKYLDIEPVIQAPWAQGADDLLTRQCARRARSADSYLVSTLPDAWEDDSTMNPEASRFNEARSRAKRTACRSFPAGAMNPEASRLSNAETISV